MDIIFNVPCIDAECKGVVSFPGDGKRTVVGYQFMLHTKGERCPVCGKKMRLEFVDSAGPFGFRVAAYPPL